MKRRPIIAGVFIASLLLGTASNVLLFRAQEGELADPHRALIRNPSDTPLTLVTTHGRNVGSRFTLYTWLGERMPGTTVVLVPGHPLVTEALLGLGRADVRYGDHEPELPPALATVLLEEALVTDWFHRYRFARESSLEEAGEPAVFARGDFAVVASEERPEELRVYWSDDIVFLVDDASLAAARELAAPR